VEHRPFAGAQRPSGWASPWMQWSLSREKTRRPRGSPRIFTGGTPGERGESSYSFYSKAKRRALKGECILLVSSFFSGNERNTLQQPLILLQQLGIISSRRQKPPVHHAEARYIHSRKRLHCGGKEMLPLVGRSM
jgi:hypothetical protein